MRPGDLAVPVTSNVEPCDTGGLHVAVALAIDPDVPGWDAATWDTDRWAGRDAWHDVTGDVRGVVVDRPANDQSGQPGAAQLTFTLDNRTGAYSQDGQLQGAGAAVAVWTDRAGVVDWRFYGFVSAWEQDYGDGPNPSSRRRRQQVTVTAFDALGLLDQAVTGLTYQQGAEGDFTAARLAFLAALGGWQRGVKLDVDTVTHRSIASTNPLLESMQVTAESAGGLVAVDVDGQLLYLDAASLRGGRTDHAQPVLVVTDTCTGDVDLWDGDLITDDAALINRVVLTNVDGVQVVAADQLSIDRYRTRLLALDAQTWADPRDAQALAQSYVDRFAFLQARVEGLTIYGPPPVPLRIGDLIRYVRDLETGRVDVNLRVVSLGWSTGPGPDDGLAGEVWQVTTGPVTSFNDNARFDLDRWDTAAWSY